jgi:hypothetical protein
MVDEKADVPDGNRIETGFKELTVVAYVDRFKVVGVAFFGVGHRATSRRASDFIRSFNDTRLTLADADIFDSHSGELLEKSPFVVLNLDKVDLIYARDEESSARARGDAGPPAGAQAAAAEAGGTDALSGGPVAPA